ncbi:MAG: VanW family protein [Clostridia bacterium]|nr:VanW family protein [Clostridia bacterium]
MTDNAKQYSPHEAAGSDKRHEKPGTLAPKRTRSTGNRAGKASGRQRARTASKKHKKPSCWWALPVAVSGLVIVMFVCLLAAGEVRNFDRFRKMKTAVQNEGFYAGTVIDNIDVSGYSYSDMLAVWADKYEKQYSERSILFEVQGITEFVSAQDLGYESDYAETLERAWHAGRSGTLEERYRSINASGEGAVYEVKRTLYDPEKLREFIDALVRKYTIDVSQASVTGFDFDRREFTFEQSAPGFYIDADELYKNAAALLESGGGVLAVETLRVEPSQTTSELASHVGMITQAVTRTTGSSKERETNIQLACAAINGTILYPGETFSFNDTVGKRTKAAGYQIATVYSSGEVSKDVGGGICQVSTTLWNAAMKADCENVERHEHSLPVAYVDRGKDATVSWGVQDMKFKNTSDMPMYIVCYTNENRRLYCEIYGKLLADGVTITVEAKTTNTIKPGDPVYVLNTSLPAGTEVEVSEARTGYRAVAYRVYHDAQGNEIKREELAKSYYKSAAARIEYNR